MKIKLLADYRGVLSSELFYVAGEYDAPGNMPEDVALALVEHGRAEEIKPEAKPVPKPKQRTTRKKVAK